MMNPSAEVHLRWADFLFLAIPAMLGWLFILGGIVYLVTSLMMSVLCYVADHVLTRRSAG